MNQRGGVDCGCGVGEFAHGWETAGCRSMGPSFGCQPASVADLCLFVLVLFRELPVSLVFFFSSVGLLVFFPRFLPPISITHLHFYSVLQFADSLILCAQRTNSIVKVTQSFRTFPIFLAKFAFIDYLRRMRQSNIKKKSVSNVARGKRAAGV